MPKAKMVLGFLLAAQSVFAQQPPAAATDLKAVLSALVSLPEGPHGHWTLHGHKQDITITCINAKAGSQKADEPTITKPFLSFNADGKHAIEVTNIDLSFPVSPLGIQQSDAAKFSMITLTLDADKYCGKHGVRKGGAQQFVNDVATQLTRQLLAAAPKPTTSLAKPQP